MTAISVRNVSKKFRLFASPQDRLFEIFHPFRKRYHREFLALNGVSLDIPKGQTIGIIGRNGSGKSTLLQIIAGILQPTDGSVVVNGRVAALLELGAGFNPEFTGRDNVMLNGALLGIGRDEMIARIPQIEAFADIGEFFDQPVKTYSSGMFVRVAFAATIHVDPDILIIDEALAVGDAKFQHKCYEHLSSLRERGITILFVTHSMALVTTYAQHAVLMDYGQLVADGEPGLIVDKYHELLFGRNSSPASSQGVMTEEAIGGVNLVISEMGSVRSTMDVCHSRRSYNKTETRFGNGEAKIIDFALQYEDRWDVVDVPFRSVLNVYVRAVFLGDVEAPAVGFCIKTVEGVYVYATNTIILGERLQPISKGEVRVFKFAFTLNISPGDYFLDLGVMKEDGTRGGCVLDVRRSIAHCLVCADRDRPFDGLVDLATSFEVLEEQLHP
ncbi:MAG TPA: sugar ABC transporter ATP-binding protein [Nitrospira sp.]|nr:sugar ABC transporter ATP-binding protein [Nitrospira sp.]HBR50034.1 sugar ABC transporter ATP-binding protein [Nitrospira sp.]